MSGNDRFYDNLAILDTEYDGKTYGSNHVALNESGDTGQSVDLTVDNEGGDKFLTYFDVASEQFKSISTAEININTNPWRFS